MFIVTVILKLAHLILRTGLYLTLHLAMPLAALLVLTWTGALAYSLLNVTRQMIIPYAVASLSTLVTFEFGGDWQTMAHTINGHLRELSSSSLEMAVNYLIGSWTCDPPVRYMYMYTYQQTSYCEWYNRNTAPVEDHFANTITIISLLCTTVFFVLVYIIYNWTRHTGLTPGMWMREKLDAQLEPQKPFQASSIRARFSEIPLVNHTPIKNHTHGASAANRSTGNLFVDQLARLTGQHMGCNRTA